jgi:hypothetical protein
MKAAHLSCVLAAFISAARAPWQRPTNSRQTNIEHSVLRPGQEISFRNRNGTVVVRWKDEFTRTYIVNGVAYTAHLEGRPEEFEGRKGIYDAALFHTKADDRKHPPRRFVVEESRVDFDNTSSMGDFLGEYRDYYAWVANSGGYVAGYRENPERNQVNVSLYRLYLDGKPARKIPGQHLAKGVITSPQSAR